MRTRPTSRRRSTAPRCARELDARLGAPLTACTAFELAFARAVTRWQQDEAAHAGDSTLAQRYAAWASHTPAGKAAHQGRRAVPRAAQARLT